MSSFTSPHLDLDTGWCRRLNTDCVPGRKGFMLQGKVSFVVPAEVRVRALEEEKRRSQMAVSSRQPA
jgi:hypothetical protein